MLDFFVFALVGNIGVIGGGLWIDDGVVVIAVFILFEDN